MLPHFVFDYWIFGKHSFISRKTWTWINSTVKLCKTFWHKQMSSFGKRTWGYEILCLLWMYILKDLKNCIHESSQSLFQVTESQYFPYVSYNWASLVAQTVKNLPAMQDTHVQSLDWEDPQRRESTLSLPREPHGQWNLAGYGPWGDRVRHDWATNTSLRS